MTETPDFSKVAKAYSASRPAYPPELFAWLASQAPGRGLAWDTATGSGQAALGLVGHFERVVATDVSAAQVRHATPHPRVGYRVAHAESSGLPDESADLIVAAAAIHWFDLPRFYEEARRVARPGGVLAAWTYHVAHVDPPFDDVFGPFYRDVVAPHFAPGARLVDDRYEGLALPGRLLEAPPFVVSMWWTASDLLRFVRSWSGVQSYMEATGRDPVEELVPRLERVCGAPETVHEVRWPLYLRASRVREDSKERPREESR